jgi:hypothetical protein
MTKDKQPQTKSEALFLDYCNLRGYVATSICKPADGGQFPDYEVIIGKTRIIAEVKEIRPSPRDEEMAKAIQEKRIQGFGGENGRRARTHIEDAERQLRRYSDQGVPCLVVLYDNIVVNGFRPNRPEFFPVDVLNPLYPYHIDVGMYGLEAQRLRLHQDGRTELLGDMRGGKRTLRLGHQDNISAVVTLHDYDTNRGLFLIIYHNLFARNPLPRGVFVHSNDTQLEKPSHPEFCPGNWQPIGAFAKPGSTA